LPKFGERLIGHNSKISQMPAIGRVAQHLPLELALSADEQQLEQPLPVQRSPDARSQGNTDAEPAR